ncbi:MAG: Coenzyme F420 hydrogenase/dehydrogenase, beta subunit C-terminal domain [Rikenellaceae bacterium]
MIELVNKGKCYGCEACVQICPQRCILFNQDSEGFFYPKVDKTKCVECGLCEDVCPIEKEYENIKPIKIIAFKNQDEQIRVESASGGMFTAIAKSVLDDGGVVFGAKLDSDWSVVHSWCETIEGVALFRGSKYVQSRIGNCFIKVRDFLDSGRKVLFSGTPCQTVALKQFLKRDYDRLILLDIICHGVPSPGVWQSYLTYIKEVNNLISIKSVLFRDKKFTT